ncbi:MAG: hypothetical protein ACOYM3_22340 [Terrimicrobiaceae bacterium]
MDVLKLTDAERSAYDAYIQEQRNKISDAESTILRAERAEADLAQAKAREDDERRQKEAALAELEELKRKLRDR